MKQINYKYLAAGILIGCLSPYIIALIKSYWSPEKEKAPTSPNLSSPYGN
jgi:hypothetical protein